MLLSASSTSTCLLNSALHWTGPILLQIGKNHLAPKKHCLHCHLHWKSWQLTWTAKTEAMMMGWMTITSHTRSPQALMKQRSPSLMLKEEAIMEWMNHQPDEPSASCLCPNAREGAERDLIATNALHVNLRFLQVLHEACQGEEMNSSPICHTMSELDPKEKRFPEAIYQAGRLWCIYHHPYRLLLWWRTSDCKGSRSQWRPISTHPCTLFSGRLCIQDHLWGDVCCTSNNQGNDHLWRLNWWLPGQMLYPMLTVPASHST